MSQDQNVIVEEQAPVSNEERLVVEVPTEIQAGAFAYGCTVYSCSSIASLSFDAAVLPALISA